MSHDVQESLKGKWMAQLQRGINKKVPTTFADLFHCMLIPIFEKKVHF